MLFTGMRVMVPVGAVCVLSLAGCGAGIHFPSSAVAASAVELGGNWSVVAAGAPANASQIAGVAGALSVNGSAVNGVLHTQAVTGQKADALCFATKIPFAVSGTTNADGTLTLTSASFGGSTMTVTGTYDAASRTLKNATFAVDGACAVALQPAVATQYQPISGTYAGTFVSDGGGSLPVTATLTQTSAADANGNFTLQGSGAFAANGCVTSPVVSSSAVTGNSVAFTYTDGSTHATVAASGTFNNDATVLTIAAYTLGGATGCSDTGHGTLTKQ